MVPWKMEKEGRKDPSGRGCLHKQEEETIV
jgi:hypothetical protein